jgi:hypothetical protein
MDETFFRQKPCRDSESLSALTTLLPELSFWSLDEF